MKLLEDYNLNKLQVNFFVFRMNMLLDKVNFELYFNDNDKRLLEVIEEYDFLIPDFINEYCGASKNDSK